MHSIVEAHANIYFFTPLQLQIWCKCLNWQNYTWASTDLAIQDNSLNENWMQNEMAVLDKCVGFRVKGF